MDDARKPPGKAKIEEKKSEDPPREKLVYTNDKLKLIELARAEGLTDLEITKIILSGVADVNTRKYLLLEYAELFRKTPNEILREAAKHGLVPSSRMPPKKR